MGKNRTPTKILPTTKPVRRNNQRSVLLPRPLLKICYKRTRAQGQNVHRWRKARGDTGARANERDGNRLDRSSYRREPTTPRGEPPVFCFSRWFLRRSRRRLLSLPISFVLHRFLLLFCPSSLSRLWILLWFYAVWNYISQMQKNLHISLSPAFPSTFNPFSLIPTKSNHLQYLLFKLFIYLFLGCVLFSLSLSSNSNYVLLSLVWIQVGSKLIKQRKCLRFEPRF